MALVHYAQEPQRSRADIASAHDAQLAAGAPSWQVSAASMTGRGPSAASNRSSQDDHSRLAALTEHPTASPPPAHPLAPSPRRLQAARLTCKQHTSSEADLRHPERLRTYSASPQPERSSERRAPWLAAASPLARQVTTSCKSRRRGAASALAVASYRPPPTAAAATAPPPLRSFRACL